jgi:regulator of nonsense transcripts 1
MNALGGVQMLQKHNVAALFKHEGAIKTSNDSDVALQAWAACRAGTLPALEKILSTIPRINTLSMKEQV